MHQGQRANDPVLDEHIVREVLRQLREHPWSGSREVMEGRQGGLHDHEQSLCAEAICDYWLSRPARQPGPMGQAKGGHTPRESLREGE